MVVYTARFLLPISSPPLRDGAVAVEDGRIVCAGGLDAVLGQVGGNAERRDLGHAALLPGLVNAHTHLELSWLAAEPPAAGGFTAWVRDLLDRREQERPEPVIAAAERELARLAERGTVAVGDVANRPWVAASLARSPLLGIQFQEVYGFRPTDAEALIADCVDRVERLAAEPDVAAAADRLRIVPTPHAPHTTSAALLRGLAGRSAAAKEPLSIHVAESEAETLLLRDGSGPFQELLRERGSWEEGWVAPGQTPVEYLDRLGVLSPRALLVHGIRLDSRDRARLQAAGATVVTCPRSNERLGLGVAPVARLAADGVRVALGTDSLASAPDLDLFAEIRALRRLHPQIAPRAALRMATLNGAAALGLADRLGSIEAGKLARLVVVPLASAADDPLEAICSCPERVYSLETAPWSGGP